MNNKYFVSNRVFHVQFAVSTIELDQHHLNENNRSMAIWVWVNFVSDNSLLPGSIKPLLEPMLSITTRGLWRSPESNVQIIMHTVRALLCFVVVNSSLPGHYGRHFADGIFRCIFVKENFCILMKISLKSVPKSPIDNNPALV